MTADYNGWNDAPEAEREAMDVYSCQESERESRAKLEELQKSAVNLRDYVRTMGYCDLRPAASAAAVQQLIDSVVDSVTRLAA